MTTAFQMLLTLATIGQKDAVEASLAAMQGRAESSRVTLVNAPTAKPRFVANPVFRYSDQLRHIEDAGIWIWTVGGRPVSALKVEHYEPGVLKKQWLYCFASLSTDFVVAEWSSAPAFHAKKPGITWQPLPDKPADARAGRLVQMREMARRFSAELIRLNEQLQEERSQMRLLPRPLYRYDEGAEAAVDGAVFGFTGTGTNPDLMLMLDLSRDAGWQFGFATMTAEGLDVRLDEKTVWQAPHTGGKPRPFETWNYFLPNE